MNLEEQLKSKIRNIPDYPKPGIIFRDITTLINDADGFQLVMSAFGDRYKEYEIDFVAGIEARGFIIGGGLADRLQTGFVPIRKKGKLPAETVSFEYELEYGMDAIEMHRDAIHAGARVLLIDDLLATGGTSIAAAKLVEQLGGKVVELAFIVDLPDVGGREKIQKEGYSLYYLCEFEGD
jgi:adenine phosphoribosyltransferase